ncbi:MAG TPA: PfkB family carbohydrate kinase [Candidatus Paceibacterota bacterium]|nr:PfkB family carbohydrate kinase [Verrucomicrobiota bacterium]HSA09506.1 PfkB family carbohydrate kinase [Candidatus Paceibacterota bacterium]
MDAARFNEIVERYPALRIAVVGDFCLDRYLEIDPTKQETSLETGLPVHNVVNVRAQPGGAGTIVNNLAALGIGAIFPLGLIGEDGEGYELCRALEGLAGVQSRHMVRTPHRHTFTYCKPLMVEPHKPPVELNRLDLKNWTPTSTWLQELLATQLLEVAAQVDAIIVLDQVGIPETGVVTRKVLAALESLVETRPGLLVLADSRRGLRGFPPVVFKMNAAELSALTGMPGELSPAQIEAAAVDLARRNGRNVFVTQAARGMLGATPDGQTHCTPALPRRGEIDVVGAGDAVSANLTVAMAAGATLSETLELANAAASVVVHKLGTTGTADVPEIRRLAVSPGNS